MANIVKVTTDDLIDFLKSIGVWGEFDKWEVYDFIEKLWRPFDINFKSAELWWCEMPWVGELPRPYLNNCSLDDVARKRAEELPDDATLYVVEATHIFGALRRKRESDMSKDRFEVEKAAAWESYEQLAYERRFRAIALLFLFVVIILYLVFS
jgi:hypothetical protein